MCGCSAASSAPTARALVGSHVAEISDGTCRNVGPLANDVREAHDRDELVVKLVGHAASELAECFHLLRFAELLLGFAAMGNVFAKRSDADHATAVHERGVQPLALDTPAIFCDERVRARSSCLRLDATIAQRGDPCAHRLRGERIEHRDTDDFGSHATEESFGGGVPIDHA